MLSVLSFGASNGPKDSILVSLRKLGRDRNPLSVFGLATLNMLIRSNSEIMATSESLTATSVLGLIVDVAVEGLQSSRISVCWAPSRGRVALGRT